MPKFPTEYSKREKAPLGLFLFSTSLGEMALVWREDKIVAARLPEKNRDHLISSLAAHFGVPALSPSSLPPAFVASLANKIDRHLEGSPERFSLKELDLEDCGPFFQKIYECASKIPPGTVRTYGQLAEEAGNPKAFRAVGQAMARNPFPLIIPCHRVIGSSQSLTGFSAHGGINTKKRLLEMEGYPHADRTNHQS
jgi:methylated-DNA-[protein]-cysteine S-methyltransferase